MYNRWRASTRLRRLRSRVQEGARAGTKGEAKCGAKVIDVFEPHRHPGKFIARSKDYLLVTENLAPGAAAGESIYGSRSRVNAECTKVEYRAHVPRLRSLLERMTTRPCEEHCR